MRRTGRVAAWAVAVMMMVGPASGQSGLTEREKMLLERIGALEERIAALERRLGPAAAPVAAEAARPAAPQTGGGEWRGTTVGVSLDGYASWNTNRPAGRVNALRAYDGTANSFSLSQAGVVVERAPDVAAGRRVGFRVDLMAGQATETLQGSIQNEDRPQVYRHVFQAYGTYVAPVGRGLTVDFGKWASALGPEGNYAKDQINYTRSYFFSLLPYYHMGLRTTYAVNGQMSATYWLVNGANQTEDFNGFKSQLGQVVVKPSANVTWTTNYYNGREQRPVAGRTPEGRLHVVDSYAFWNAREKLTLGGEFDYVLNRVERGGAPQRVVGGAAYLRYQIAPRVYVGQRYTRLNDRAGLFSGVRQNLNDVTSTVGVRLAEGFETRAEYRRDFSNVPFFARSEAGRLRRYQETVTLGLLWWFGGKSGSW